MIGSIETSRASLFGFRPSVYCISFLHTKKQFLIQIDIKSDINLISRIALVK